MTGVLRVVATPLGNLGDLSARAREALASADAIAAEDTRRTGQLLKLLGLPPKPFLSYFAPKEAVKAGAIIDRLLAGGTVALVTDGGTPGVSDPGAVLVREALAKGIRVEPIPGPSAVALALSVSAHGSERFIFEGFLPSKSVGRRKRLEELSDETRTLVFYEAPHRLAAMLADLGDVFGADRHATVVREATKIHEEVREGTLAELAQAYSNGTKGEIVVVVAGGSPDLDRIRLDVRRLLTLALACGLSPDRAAIEVAAISGISRNRLNRLAKELHQAPSS
jgi:16S rRNA (cytidine1402-2'-O)-methyltransferase